MRECSHASVECSGSGTAPRRSHAVDATLDAVAGIGELGGRVKVCADQKAAAQTPSEPRQRIPLT
eukprot:3709679-Rhodomonas_salina.2